MAITFPQSPSTNDTHVVGNISYVWDGAKWAGGGITPIDRLIEDSNILEIENNNLLWTGSSVGIGTDTPAEKLEVYGNARFKDTDGSHGIEFYPDVSSAGYQRIISFNRTSSAYEDLSIGVSDFIVTNGSSSEALRITSDGNIGLGANSPSRQLHIRGAAPIIRLDDTGGGYSEISANTAVLSLRSDEGDSESNSRIDFRIDGSEKLRITSGGLVGISNAVSQAYTNEGTYTTKLRVGSDTLESNQASAIQIGGRDSSGSGVIGAIEFFNHRDNDIIAKIISRRDLGLATKLSAGQLDFYTDDGDGNLNRHLTIDANGNVGIGINNPGYKLEVNGSFAATTKSFVIDHPTKEGMKLRYASLEGPENGVYIRGKTTEFVIELPDYWTGLVDEDTISVNLTPIGKSQTLWVKSIEDNKVIVGSKCTSVEYFYTIYGERKDVEKLEVEIGA